MVLGRQASRPAAKFKTAVLCGALWYSPAVQLWCSLALTSPLCAFGRLPAPCSGIISPLSHTLVLPPPRTLNPKSLDPPAANPASYSTFIHPPCCSSTGARLRRPAVSCPFLPRRLPANLPTNLPTTTTTYCVGELRDSHISQSRSSLGQPSEIAENPAAST